MKSLGVIGECMLELRQNDTQYVMGYGGDVFNTAVYAARSGLPTSFFSATGDDHYSDYLLESWQSEGVSTQTVRILSGRTPGLYIIQTDEHGERSFHYWRSNTPFKDLLEPGNYVEQLPDLLKEHDCIYFSGISLALFSSKRREDLLQLLSDYRTQGGRIAFDPNYRPKLWYSREEASLWIDKAYSITDVALPSYDDENALRGPKSQTSIFNHIHGLGVSDVILKNGENGATISDGGEPQTQEAITAVSVVDTTAAGDSFNGSYLSSRLKGNSNEIATASGCAAAAKVIQHAGAIIPRTISLS